MRRLRPIRCSWPPLLSALMTAWRLLPATLLGRRRSAPAAPFCVRERPLRRFRFSVGSRTCAVLPSPRTALQDVRRVGPQRNDFSSLYKVGGNELRRAERSIRVRTCSGTCSPCGCAGE